MEILNIARINEEKEEFKRILTWFVFFFFIPPFSNAYIQSSFSRNYNFYFFCMGLNTTGWFLYLLHPTQYTLIYVRMKFLARKIFKNYSYCNFILNVSLLANFIPSDQHMRPAYSGLLAECYKCPGVISVDHRNYFR